jgi:hypothetical protein
MRRILLTVGCICLAHLQSNAQTVRFVTNNLDNGPGSFRNVVAQALNGDTIRFQVTGTITLVTGSVVYDKDLVIEGPGVELLTLSGGGVSNVLLITGHSSRISGLTITDGLFDSIADRSGGLDFTGDTLYLEDVRITDCTNFGSADFKSGAGASVDAARSRIRSCRFEGNELACSSGGLAVGGALFVVSDDAVVEDCQFLQNTVNGSGGIGSNGQSYGGALAAYGRIKLDRCTFEGNSAFSSASFFGGVYYNANSYGGALYVSDAEVELVDCHFTGNSVAAYSTAPGEQNSFGGGIGAQYSEIRINDCTFNSNLAGLSSTSTAPTLSQGGGIYMRNGYLTLENCYLDSNEARVGTGIFQDKNTDTGRPQGLTMIRSRISHGIGPADGWAISVGTVGRVDLYDTEVSENGQSSLFARADTNRLERCLFAGNHGGIFLRNPTTNENHIFNSTFTRSAATTAALTLENTTFTMMNCTLVDDSLSTPGIRELAIYSCTAILKNNIFGETYFHGNSAFGQQGSGVISGGGNVCGDGSMVDHLTQPTDLNNTQPGVEAFGDNGGFTRTWSLLPTSTCIDRGGQDTLMIDQRGFLRDGNSDSGAFEFGGSDPSISGVSVSPDLLVCQGQSLEVSVTATSAVDLNYQWYVNGELIADATNATYIATAEQSSAGSYTCSVWNTVDSLVAGPIVVEVDICEGLASMSRLPIRIYPNPTDADRGLFIEPPPDTKLLNLRLTDMAGRIILQQTQNGAGRSAIPLHGIAAGVYVLRMRSNEGPWEQRIVIR